MSLTENNGTMNEKIDVFDIKKSWSHYIMKFGGEFLSPLPIQNWLYVINIIDSICSFVFYD